MNGLFAVLTMQIFLSHVLSILCIFKKATSYCENCPWQHLNSAVHI
jgi:hypothetical protein